MVPRSTASQFEGEWRIIEIEGWGEDYIDLVGPGIIQFNNRGDGEMCFGAVEIALDWREAKEAQYPRLEFSFAGSGDGDPVSGRGWAELQSRALSGRIYFHQGDESDFTAKKVQPRSIK